MYVQTTSELTGNLNDPSLEPRPLKRGSNMYRPQLVINEITGNMHGRLDRNMSDTHRTDQ